MQDSEHTAALSEKDAVVCNVHIWWYAVATSMKQVSNNTLLAVCYC
jgi:hypothetical protein